MRTVIDLLLYNSRVNPPSLNPSLISLLVEKKIMHNYIMISFDNVSYSEPDTKREQSSPMSG